MIDNIQFNFGLVISSMDTEEETSYIRLVQCSHFLIYKINVHQFCLLVPS